MGVLPEAGAKPVDDFPARFGVSGGTVDRDPDGPGNGRPLGKVRDVRPSVVGNEEGAE